MNRQPVSQTHHQQATANSTASGLLQRKCVCGNHTMGGECAECSKKQQSGLQAKLKVGEPGDSYEREADWIAAQVLAAPGNSAVSGVPPRIQRFSGRSNGQMDAAPASVHRVLASPGRPLDPMLRQDMEQRFGHDFSRVRVHSGATAEQSARDVSARAYTVGQNIVFGAGSYAPRSEAGCRLLAHELAHTLQQGGYGRRVQRALAGGCAEPGDTWPESMAESSRAGINAHEQIQEKFFPQLDIEAELPRGTKERQGKGCPKKTWEPGKLDLWRSTGERTVQIGEIKSVNSEATGLDEVQHYLLRYRQMIERLRGGDCYEAVADEKDEQFVSKWLHRNIEKDELPEAVALNSIVPTTKRLVGVYRGNPTKDLFCKRVQGGAVVYWCNKKRRRKKDDKDEKRREERDAPSVRVDAEKGSDLTLPAIIGTGLALLGSIAAVHWPRATAPKPAAPGPTPSLQPQPQVQAPKPTTHTTRRLHQRPPPAHGGTKAGAGPRGHRPGSGTRPKSPRVSRPRLGGRTGGMRAPSQAGAIRLGVAVRVAGGFLALLSLYEAYKTFRGAKADIDAMRGPYEALWEEFEKLRAARNQGENTAAVAPPTPPPTPPRAEPQPAQKPPEKETNVRLFEITRLRLSEREASVPSASIGVTYFPVEFFSLTPPGERTSAIDAGQIDCARIHKGIGGVSGYQPYTGYARARDVQALNELLGNQITLARLACVLSGRGPQAAELPDGDEISVTLSASGEAVTAACKKLVGAADSTCTAAGNFASMKALMDDPELEVPPDFLLEVAVVRTRNGESHRSDSTISVWIENLDHPAPEPHVQADGSVPESVSDWKAYPSGSEIAYLLELYSRWRR